MIALSLPWLAWLLTLPPRPSAWIVALSGLPLMALGSWVARAQGESWRAFVARTLDGHALAILLLIALGVHIEDSHGITTDGVIYFSQLRSVVFDRDLDVAAEFAFLGQPPRPYHVVPIGPTLVWLPLYGLMAAIGAAGRAVGAWDQPDPSAIGLTLPYIRAALVSSFAIGTIGLCLVHRLVRAEFGRGVAFASTLLLFAATPLVWYMVYEPSMTHAASFGFVAIFVAAVSRWTSIDITARQSLGLGALIGLAFVTRPQEAVFAILPAFLVLASPVPLGTRVRAAARLGAWAFVGAAPFLAAQAIHSSILFGREHFSLVGAEGYLDLLHSRWADTLWSSWHGFLSWSPVAYVALLGTVAYLTRRWKWAGATLVIVFVMAWVNGSTADWAAGWSFGGRRFISCLVLLAPGLAFAIQQLSQRPIVPIAAAAVAAIAWNQLLVAQYSGKMLPTGEPVSFAHIVRQQAAMLTRPPFFYPFAFPANAWFAWRTGLPIDRYDLLGPEPLHPSIALLFDGAASRFLMDGWGPRASDQWGDVRWIEGARAELVLPLALPRERSVHLEIEARTRLLELAVPSSVRVFVNGVEIGLLTPDTQQPSTASFTVAPERWIPGFNRVVFERAPSSPPVGVYRMTITTSSLVGRD